MDRCRLPGWAMAQGTDRKPIKSLTKVTVCDIIVNVKSYEVTAGAL